MLSGQGPYLIKLRERGSEKPFAFLTSRDTMTQRRAQAHRFDTERDANLVLDVILRSSSNCEGRVVPWSVKREE